MDFLHTVFFFVVAVGVLVAFHEFGHFWVARKLGVKVLRFSVGFGKVIWSRKPPNQETEYVLSAIPLGGYVKMVDEREGLVDAADLPRAFNRQALWVRSAIVIAGPIFNLMLAVLMFWGVFLLGEEGLRPVLGKVPEKSLAAQAGFLEGDEILKINLRQTPTWSEAFTTLISETLESDQALSIEVKSADQQILTRSLVITSEAKKNPDTLYNQLGFQPWQPKLKPIIGKILPNSAAESSELKSGDLILKAEGEIIDDWMQWVNFVQSRPNQVINLLIERDGVQLTKQITPRSEASGQEKPLGKIGAAVQIPDDVMAGMRVKYQLSLLPALGAAFDRTWYYSRATLKMMGQMLIGKASVENLSGPISIAQYAGQSASMGLVQFLKFLALVSVSLGVLNLLPVPMLDGGHLLFYVYEGIRGKPLPEKVQSWFQQVGIVLLLSLMVLAMYLDLNRLFQ